MKISLSRSHFLKALQHSNNIIERRTTVPILANILIDATGEDQVLFTSTDLEISIVETVPAAIEAKGKITVSGKMLHDIVRKLPGDVEIFLTLNEEGSRLSVESGKSHFELSVLSPDDYPAVTIAELPNTFSIPAKTLLSLFDRTAFAMSTEETRYYLNGIYMHATEDGKLRAVATDGHRMARMQAPLPKGAEGIPGVIISRKTISQIQDIASDTDQDIKVSLSETQISVRFENAYLISRLVDGQFPEYERVVPKNADKSFSFNPSYMATVVDRVATMASEKTHGVKLAIDNGKISFSADGSGFGTADEEMSIEYGDSPVSIGFNSKYLLDVTDKMNGKDAEMSFSDEASPVMIQGVEEKEAMYVLMPMRI